MKKERIVWSNDINLEDWKDFLKEEYPDVTDEEEQYNLAYETNNWYLDDERCNLDYPVDLLIIADLGTWRGRFSGYKEVTGSLSDIFYSECDYVKWYMDKRKDLAFTGHHHDGTNYYTYREWKDGTTETQKENLKEKIYNGTATRKDITRVTKSLYPILQKVYGW